MAAGMRLDKSDLEALKAANPIEEVARELGWNVVNHRMRCPLPDRHTHGDRTPSVTFWPDKNSFKCWVCPEVRGDVISLVMLAHKGSFPDAVHWLRQRVGQTAQVPFSPSSPSGPMPASPREPQIQKPARAQVDAVESPPPTKDDSTPKVSRQEVLSKLLECSAPISGPAAKYLQSRRIFKRTWEKQHLRWIDHYGRIADDLVSAFGLEALQTLGFFNAVGHFRYYRHVLLFPYFDAKNQPAYLQVRAIQPDVTPKELSLSGTIPLPYNVPLLKEPGRFVYLCEGVIDTLTLLEQGFPAIGVPGAANFKAEWAPLFIDKTVFIVFDPDAAGEAGAHRVEALLGEIGVLAKRGRLPEGRDINEWLRLGGKPLLFE
jgi:DNA primase